MDSEVMVWMSKRVSVGMDEVTTRAMLDHLLYILPLLFMLLYARPFSKSRDWILAALDWN